MTRPVKRSVSLAIHHPNGRVLQIRRPPDDEDLPLAWGLPAASLRPGEDWEDAVRRAARDKLDVEVEPGGVLREGALERDAYRLEMRLYEARILHGNPTVIGRDPSITHYVDLRWGTAEGLEPAARAGSLCSLLYLDNREEGGSMNSIELTDRESEIVVETLRTALSDLRMEITDTDSKDYRERLKERKAALEKAIDGLTPSQKRN